MRGVCLSEEKTPHIHLGTPRQGHHGTHSSRDATAGGGNGQRIRDQILEIIHRHHLGEKAGTFIEDWHQKLHNNTTPDDIVICEA